MIKTLGIGGHQSANMRTDEWLTPPEILAALGEFDLDPCSPVNRPWPTAKHHFTINDNGLAQKWFGEVWLNPPYGREIAQWMYRMAMHTRGVGLIFARTETEFFQEFVAKYANSLFFLKGRLNFYNTAGIRSRLNAGAPSVLIAYGEQNSERLDISGLKGFHQPLTPTIIVVGISVKWISIVSIAVKQFGDKDLQPIYDMVERIAPDKVCNNRHWKEKIRQQIQIIRKKSTSIPCETPFL